MVPSLNYKAKIVTSYLINIKGFKVWLEMKRIVCRDRAVVGNFGVLINLKSKYINHHFKTHADETNDKT